MNVVDFAPNPLAHWTINSAPVIARTGRIAPAGTTIPGIAQVDLLLIPQRLRKKISGGLECDSAFARPLVCETIWRGPVAKPDQRAPLLIAADRCEDPLVARHRLPDRNDDRRIGAFASRGVDASLYEVPLDPIRKESRAINLASWLGEHRPDTVEEFLLSGIGGNFEAIESG